MTKNLTSRDPDPGRLDRGTFHDDYRTYTVRASSADAPDSFQVLTGDRRDDVVLVVSGINSGNLRATWGPFWARMKLHSREFIEDQAFRVFYSVNRETAYRGTRFCDG